MFSDSFVSVSKLFLDEFFESFVILSATIILIKSPATSVITAPVITLFEVVLCASVSDCLA